MRARHFASIAFVVGTFMLPATGHADPYKWCALYGRGGGEGTNCGFVTLAQCQATVSGIGGYCEPNPRYTGPQRRKSTTGSRVRD
jgi:hypothetical protein